MEQFKFLINGAETDGFTDNVAFPEPEDETEVREQLNSLHTQTKDFINSQIVSTVNQILLEMVKNVTSDGSITVTKEDGVVTLSVSIAGGGATIAYVDHKASVAEANAKSYADTKDAETLDAAKIYAENKATDLVNSHSPYPVKVVDALPAIPDPSTLYFVKE